MSILKREQRSLPATIDPYQITARPYYPNYSGEIVTETNVFQSTAVLASVTIIADSIATMPIQVYRNRGGTIEQLPLPMVFQKPNDGQTMFQFVHQTLMTLCIHGNAFIFAPRDAGQPPLEMRNLHPERMMVTLDSNGNASYRYNKSELEADDIYHITWIQMPQSVYGLSPLEAFRNIVGTGIAIDRFLAQFYGEGATPSSVLETDQQITSEQANILRDTWEDSHRKRRRPAVLAGGLKWRSITASASDMDTMTHRDAIVRDIARAYRIPLHLILGTGGDNQTYQNVESAGINFVRHTLLPWMKRLEDTFGEMLPRPHKVRFDADDLMRADLSTRVNAQKTQISSGTLSPNEARAIEGREPYEGGDNFVIALGTAEKSGTDPLPPEALPTQMTIQQP